MNTKDILGNLNDRMTFAIEVLQGLNGFFEDIANSPHGSSMRTYGFLEADIAARGHVSLRSVRPDGKLDEVDVSVFADGRIEVSETEFPDATYLNGEAIGSISDGTVTGVHAIQFAPEAEHPEDVVARTIAATMSLPNNEISPMLSEYVSAMRQHAAPSVSLSDEYGPQVEPQV